MTEEKERENMPFFSLVIPAYNNSQYLPECFDSLVAQDFEDWEAVIVIDGSPDDSALIAASYAEKDNRFVVLNEAENVGLHLARKKGVAAAGGRYSFFLDADDSLNPGALSYLSRVLLANGDADVLHFAIEVIPEGDTTLKQAEEFASYLNKGFRTLNGEEVLRSSFDPLCNFERDWRVTQRVYSTKLLKDGFALMTSDRLERAEDCYEFFVLASLASKEVCDSSFLPYRYYYGRGVTGFGGLSVGRFMRSAAQFKECYEHTIEYADSSGNQDWLRCAFGAKEKLLDLLMNDWATRVSGEDKRGVAFELAGLMGNMEIAAQLMRLARDRACSVAVGEGGVNPRELYEIAASLADFSSEDRFAVNSYRICEAAAKRHIANNDQKESLHKKQDGLPVRIFVSTHKDAAVFDSAILQSVQVGARNSSVRFPAMFHDDEGDNISELNPMYCELTTQYWAWKNVDAEYYGFCHYRRYFDFSPVRHGESAYGEIIEEYIDEATQKKYCLDDESIERLVRQYDVITTEIKDLRKFPGKVGTPRAQYHEALRLVDADLDRVIGILKEMHPDYSHDADSFLDGNFSCFCNMFIMRKEIFFDYCSWLFPILEEFVRRTDMSHYSKEALRTPGHLSERLFNIYYQHQIRLGAAWRTKQLQCVRFERPERVCDLLPPIYSAFMPIVPVVFAADGNYVPMLATTIHSMLANASSNYFYDIVVLARGVSGEDMRIMQQEYAKPGRVSLSFYDVGRIVESFDLVTSNAHISIETYYRFLVQQLLPHYDKVLYLDSDLIVQGNVAKLFAVDLSDSLLAAVRDLDFLGNVNMKDGKRLRYAKEVLGMRDPYAYFQAGVLVLNTSAMRELHSVEEWLRLAGDPRYIYNDQDILNAECEGRVRFLDYRWNVMTDCAGRVEKVFSFAPAEAYEAYLKSREDQLITHYAGFEKPWKMKTCDRAPLYWKYARQTPFYERLVRMLCAQAGDETYYDEHEFVIDKNNPMRKFIDPIMPYGSRRREAVKGVVRKIRGRK